MPTATVVTDNRELQEILQLQQQNLLSNISTDEMSQHGFLTVQHTFETLSYMQQLAPQIIIKDHNKVLAYALVMLQECRLLIPTLEPMYRVFDNLTINGRPLNSYHFYVMGQICIDKDYRGKGLFEGLYRHHRYLYSAQYDFILTEVSLRNQRSMRAHEKMGFKILHRHRDELDEWAIVYWDWQ